MIYAGIGSRKTPEWVLNTFERMGTWLAQRGHILRSGGANGADSAFERGCDKVHGQKEIYLPWKFFNGSDSPYYKVSDYAMTVASQYHPSWNILTDSVKKLMGRNSYQVLGQKLCPETMSDFIICYTENGAMTGGTAQALRIAQDYDIPIFNAGNYQKEEELVQAFNEFYKNLYKERRRTGEVMLKFQEKIADVFSYKPLNVHSYTVRDIYDRTLPSYFKEKSEQDIKPIHSPSGVLLARNYDRVVIGDYGAFVEIDPSDMILENVYVPEKQRYRIDDPHYAEHIKYHWYEPIKGYASKLYAQQKTVAYADYKAGKWYVSPFDTAEGYYTRINKFILPGIEDILSGNQPSNNPTPYNNLVDFLDGTSIWDVSRLNEEQRRAFFKVLHYFAPNTPNKLSFMDFSYIQFSPEKQEIICYNSAEILPVQKIKALNSFSLLQQLMILKDKNLKEQLYQNKNRPEIKKEIKEPER